jgi:hypothetical protein
MLARRAVLGDVVMGNRGEGHDPVMPRRRGFLMHIAGRGIKIV